MFFFYRFLLCFGKTSRFLMRSMTSDQMCLLSGARGLDGDGIQRYTYTTSTICCFTFVRGYLDHTAYSCYDYVVDTDVTCLEESCVLLVTNSSSLESLFH